MNRTLRWLSVLAFVAAIGVVTLVLLGSSVQGRLGPLCPAPSAVQVCPQTP